MATDDGIDEVRWRAAALRARAGSLEDRSGRARELACDLGRRRDTLAGRLDGVRARHVGAVWTSAAADRSRRILADEVGFGVWLALHDLGETIRALAGAAGGWDEAARLARREAETAAGSLDSPP